MTNVRYQILCKELSSLEYQFLDQFDILSTSELKKIQERIDEIKDEIEWD